MRLLDVVALTHDIPQSSLRAGQVGTAVLELEDGVFEVEFSDLDGRTYATAPLTNDDVLVLHHEPVVSMAA